MFFFRLCYKCLKVSQVYRSKWDKKIEQSQSYRNTKCGCDTPRMERGNGIFVCLYLVVSNQICSPLIHERTRVRGLYGLQRSCLLRRNFHGFHKHPYSGKKWGLYEWGILMRLDRIALCPKAKFVEKMLQFASDGCHIITSYYNSLVHKCLRRIIWYPFSYRRHRVNIEFSRGRTRL